MMTPDEREWNDSASDEDLADSAPTMTPDERRERNYQERRRMIRISNGASLGLLGARKNHKPWWATALDIWIVGGTLFAVIWLIVKHH